MKYCLLTNLTLTPIKKIEKLLNCGMTVDFKIIFIFYKIEMDIFFYNRVFFGLYDVFIQFYRNYYEYVPFTTMKNIDGNITRK